MTLSYTERCSAESHQQTSAELARRARVCMERREMDAAAAWQRESAMYAKAARYVMWLDD